MVFTASTHLKFFPINPFILSNLVHFSTFILLGSVVAQTSPGKLPVFHHAMILMTMILMETQINGDPTDVKRARRMLSNRESARRSRRRKQEQMNEFDTQAGQLRGEHSTLLSRLSDMNHKCDAAAVDNRILRADIETLRTKIMILTKFMNPTDQRVERANLLPEQVNREGMQNQFATNPNLYETLLHWNHKH
ncbi:BnaA04g27730D [Brassica napus]|uniref:(rape) hypothetical protein n=1 Tax=Brassica napus TaxID=3708 RepID=A0A078JDG1_BRANA|nr:unnamed protein product [Brassica napus]CDY64338.1 BnaA04g27730D [Brassica napus]